MQVSVFRFTSPDTAFILDANTETRSNGHNYLVFKDELGRDRDFLLNDDVKPIILGEQGGLPLMRHEKQVPMYIMARDNFMNLSKEEYDKHKDTVVALSMTNEMFKVSGAVTNEQLQKISDWGMVEALIRATKDKDKYSGWMSTLMKLLIIAAVLVGLYYFLQWMTGGSFKLPFL
jgi:hypothetical protein